jgi:hypothetical protein
MTIVQTLMVAQMSRVATWCGKTNPATHGKNWFSCAIKGFTGDQRSFARSHAMILG